MTKKPTFTSAHKDPTAPEVFDTIIIGAGPAGLTAAIYTARRKMKTLMICGDIGGQLLWCSDIQNWTGVERSTGPDLVQQFYGHVKSVDQDDNHFDLWVHEKEKVNHCTKEGDLFLVTSDRDLTYKAKTIILTTGKKPRTLGIPGEDIAMKGNGLSFAATSDAPLYAGKKMAVIGGGNSGLDVAIQLSKFTHDITLMTDIDHLIGEAVLMEKVKKNPNIKIKYRVNVKEILLDKNNKVRGLDICERGECETEEFLCEGVFEEIGQVPATKFLEGFIELNHFGEIMTDRNGKTSQSGVFAGGDCNDGKYKQVVVAAGEGAVCALSAHEYLLNHTL